jgi:NAD(P)-dependent dehydrogenase (short-subunit alcohol dehydrogenase family)
MSPELTGKVAVITGASGGIGEAIAMGLAREGARLLLAGRSADRSTPWRRGPSVRSA